MSLVCGLKYLYGCFSSHFYFLVFFFFFSLLFLFCGFLFYLFCFRSLLLFFFLFQSSCRYIDASRLSWILASILPPPFLDTYNLSKFFLRCKALSSRIFLFFCWSPTLFHFTNWPGYLSREIAQLFIPLMRLLPCSLFSSSFLVLHRCFFIYLHTSDAVRFQYSQIFVSFHFFECSDFFDLVVLFLPSFFVVHFSL